MIRTEVIDNIDAAMRLISDQDYNEDIGRLRSGFFYRGMCSSKFSLQTSLGRNCKHLQESLETPILRNFSKYARTLDPTLGESPWDQMIIGQHHGLPTRLLDWSHSPVVALHFATAEEDLSRMDKHDSVVWRIDMRDVNRNLPDHYRAELEDKNAYLFSIEMLNSLAPTTRQYDEDMQGKAFVIIEPPSIDQRIINQYAFFSVIPMGMTDIEGFLEEHSERTIRYIIKKEVRWELRDLLDQLNISERIVYPGLDGLSKWVGRHYYVK